MAVTVAEVLALLERIAPAELAEEWDNVGLLAGSRTATVETVLCALELNADVLDEAASLGAQLIVTHHPILFRGRKSLCSDDPEGRLLCKLVKSDVALIAAHTNFDNAHPGVNDALAARLGLENVQPGAHGMCVGEISPMALECFADMVRCNLGGAVRRYGDGARVICRAAVLGGAGEDFARDALAAGADVYVTGEMGYHRALSAVDDGLCVVEAGHAATEAPAVFLLADALQTAADALQYNLRVLCSQRELFL